MLRCKKDDLAICLKTMEGENVGVIAEVGDFLGDFNGQKNVWKIFLKHKPHPFEIFGGSWALPDAWLLPIRPGDLKEVEETEKEVESV